MWVGAGSEGSIRKAARDGFNLLLDQMSPFDAIGEKVAIYRDELEKLGVPFDPYRIGVTRGLMVANNDNQRSEAHVLRGKFITEVQVLTRKGSDGPKAFAPADQKHGDPTSISENGAILGDSDEMAERVQALHDLGVRNILLHDLSGNFEALHQFAEEVMPRFAGDRADAEAAE